MTDRKRRDVIGVDLFAPRDPLALYDESEPVASMAALLNLWEAEDLAPHVVGLMREAQAWRRVAASLDGTDEDRLVTVYATVEFEIEKLKGGA